MRDSRLMAMALLALSACWSILLANETAAPTPEKPITIRAVDVVMTTDHPYYVGLSDFKKRVEAESAGRLRVDIIRSPNLPTDAAVLEQIRSGGFHIGLLSTGLLASYTREYLLQAWSLPFLYKDAHAANTAWNSDAAASFARFEKHGFKCLARWDVGFRSLSANKPVESPEDLKGLKIRALQSRLLLDIWKSMGANPIVLGSAAEIYTGLMTGVVTATDMPAYYLVSSKFYEVQKYAVVLNYVDDPICVTISSDFYAKLPGDLQKIITDSANTTAGVVAADTERRSNAAPKILQSKGVTVLTPDLNPFRDAVNPIYDRYLIEQGAAGKDLLDSIRHASNSAAVTSQ
jgi:TRAP-type transport system periplasmic protein